MATSTPDTSSHSLPDTKIHHSNRLLAEINLLKDQFCDFVLVVENERFPVHKIIMASASHFIRGLLNSDMSEQREGEVKLETLDRIGVRAAVDFIYTGELDLNVDNMNSLVKAASFLQIPTLIDAIVTVLRDTLSVDTCVDHFNITDMYNLDQTYLESVTEFICDNFISLPAAQIHALSEESLVSFLSNNQLKVRTELDLVDIVQKWMLYHRNIDIFKPHTVLNSAGEPWVTFTALMTCVRWSLIPPTDLCDKLNPTVKNIMCQIIECMTWLMKSNEYHALISRQPLLQDSHSKCRGKPGMCVGWKDGCFIMHDIQDFSQLYSLSKIPIITGMSTRHHTAVTVGDFLYIICQYKKTTSDVGFRYDPRFDKWWQLPVMNISHGTSFKLFAHINRLYIISFLTSYRDTHSEYYDIKTNKWTLINNDISDVCDVLAFAGCAAENGIYVSGGKVVRNSLLNSVSRLDTATNTWQQCSPMMMARAGHVMENIGEFIYVIGGQRREGNTMYFEPKIERYSIHSDEWTVCSKTLTIPVSMACSFTKDNGIYIVGGRHANTGGDVNVPFVDLDIIQFFVETSVPPETTKTLPHKICTTNSIKNNVSVLTYALEYQKRQ